MNCIVEYIIEYVFDYIEMDRKGNEMEKIGMKKARTVAGQVFERFEVESCDYPRL